MTEKERVFPNSKMASLRIPMEDVAGEQGLALQQKNFEFRFAEKKKTQLGFFDNQTHYSKAGR